MAERDRFELDLAAALRAYLEDAPTEVRPTELARQFATAYPHRRTALGRVALRADARACAWVLLLLAALLAALVGGALLVGSQPQRKLPAVVPPVGQVFECPPGSTPDEPGPVDQARPAVADGGRRHGVRPPGGQAGGPRGRPTASPRDVDVRRVHEHLDPDASRTGSRRSFDWPARLRRRLRRDDRRLDGNRMWAYDLEANTWTEKGRRSGRRCASLRFYDPVSGLVVAWGRRRRRHPGLELWSYDVETDTWTPIRQAKPLAIGPHYEFFAYDASVDRLVAYSNAWAPAGRAGFEAKTWLFDLRTGTWSGTGAVTPPGLTAGCAGRAPAIAYDEAAQRTVMSRPGPMRPPTTRPRTAGRSCRGVLRTGECGTRPECRQGPTWSTTR